MANTQPGILVTGGCGYIGSHTLAGLIGQLYEAISGDKLSRASEKALEAVFAITGVRVMNYPVDLADAHLVSLAAMLNGIETDHCSIYNLGTGRGTSVLEAPGAASMTLCEPHWPGKEGNGEQFAQYRK